MNVRSSILAAVMIVTATAGSTLSRAEAAMAVIDNSNLAQTAATASRAAEMVTQLANLKTLQADVLKSMGVNGSFSTASDLEGVLQPADVGSVIGSVMRDANSVRSDLSAIDRVVSQIPGMADSARNVDDLRSAIRFVNKTIGMTERAGSAGESVLGEMSPKEQLMIVEARAGFAEQSAADAVGTALYHRETLSDSANTFNHIRTAATAADDLNERMAVNTAAVIAVGEEILALRSLLAAFVQQQGADSFSSRRPSGLLGSGAVGTAQAAPTETQSLGNEVFKP